jgi:heme A synthase
MDHLHSWLRFPVYLLGLAAFGYALWGLLRKRPYRKLMWDLAGAFTISLYVQIVVGFLMIFTSRYFSGPLGIHMVFSMAAAVLAQLTYSANRRRPREERDYSLHVWGVGLALVLLVVGILVMHDSGLK